MISDAGTAQLLAIAERLEHASLSCRRDPERPYIERGELAREIRNAVYAERRLVEPARRASFALGTRVIGGREIPITARHER